MFRIILFLSCSAVGLDIVAGIPRFRRQLDNSLEATFGVTDPAVVASGLHRPLAILCPSIAIPEDGPTPKNNSSCEPKCEFDSDCKKGSLCCSNICGGRSCAQPLKAAGSAESPSGLVDRAGSTPNLFCGRYICSNRETCLTVAQKSCKPTSIEVDCPTTQQCHLRGMEDCSTRVCPSGTKCVMVECSGAYCSPIPKCFGPDGEVTVATTPKPSATRPSFPPPSIPAARPSPPTGFPSFPIPNLFPTRSTPSTTSTTTAGTSLTSSQSPSPSPSGSASASASPSPSEATSGTPPASSSTEAADLAPSASSLVSSTETTALTTPSTSARTTDATTASTTSSTTSQQPSSTSEETAVASAAPLTNESEGNVSDGTTATTTSSTKPPSTTLEYLESTSSSGSSAGNDGTTSSAASMITATPATITATPATPVVTTTVVSPGEDADDLAKCDRPCAPGSSCQRISKEGCTFVDGTLVCDFESACVPEGIKCQEDSCAPWEVCVLEGKGCRNVTSDSSDVRCGPICYAPIFGKPPAVDAFRCGRNEVKCKANEACMPVVQTTCEFNAAADLECDYLDACVPKELEKACHNPVTGCHDDEHCVLEIPDDCAVTPENPKAICPPEVQCYGLSLNLTGGACADFECEKGDVCEDMATACHYDTDGDLECEFEDTCVPAALSKDCDDDVGCAEDEICVLQHVKCTHEPIQSCYPVPKCMKKRDPALPTNAPSAADEKPSVAGVRDKTCGRKKPCRPNEFCTKVTTDECTFKGAPGCVFQKACVPERLPSCKQALCPANFTCVNVKSKADCGNGECRVEPECIPLTDPSLTSTTAPTSEATSSSGAAESSSSGGGDETATAAGNLLNSGTSSQVGSNSLQTSPPSGNDANKLCGSGRKALRCDAATEFCGEVAVACISSSLTSPSTGKLSCRYEERCLRQGAPSCQTVRCADGRYCIMREVRCASTPCDPVPECVRRADYDVNPRIAGLFDRFVNN